jgi:phage-related tail fiber protein
VAELVIPSEEGGWTIREAGVFDAAGDLFAVGNLPETYKPQIAEGSAAELRVRLIMEVSNTAAVELKVDPTVVLASRGYVDAQVVEVRTLVEDHAQRTDNPHGVTAAQAGAYTKAEVDGLLGALDIIPPGTVIAWVKSTPPDGFLECNGAQVSQTTYADLYAAIGTTFGSASGKFAVPDLRGEFIRGWDHGRGVDAGRGFGTAQIDQFKSHSHQYDNFVPGNATMSSGSARDCVSANTTAVGGDETRPRNVALMYCIKY